MKSLIQKILGSTGYRISRLEPQPEGNATGVLRFGPYEIESDCLPLIENYVLNPDANQFLGRLAACLGEASPDAGIVDVGANCGDTAALMRSHTTLPILCVEGDAKLYALLQKNLGQCPDITVVNGYVGEKTGPMAVNIEKQGWNNTLVPDENSDSILQITRLDELSHAWFAKRKVGLLKVDAEGFDISILFGAKKMLAASKPVVAFEYNRENLDAISEPGLRVFSYLADLGYEGLLIYDGPGRFMMSATVQNLDLLSELHEFIRPPIPGVRYLDMVAFPKSNAELFRKFRDSERARKEADASTTIALMSA